MLSIDKMYMISGSLEDVRHVVTTMSEPVTEKFLDAYNIVLCLSPLVLIAMIILVIPAWHGNELRYKVWVILDFGG